MYLQCDATCDSNCKPPSSFVFVASMETDVEIKRRDSAKIRVLVVLPSIAGRRPSGATAPRLGFLLCHYRVRVGEGVKNSAAGKGVLGPRSLEY